MHPAQKFFKLVSTLPQHGEINIAPLTAGTHAEVDAAMRISVHPCRIGAAALTILYALWKHRCHSLGALVKAVPKDIGGGCSHELLKNVRGLRDVV